MNPAAGFGPNTIVPTATEADRDEHEQDRTCTMYDPCPACRRQNKRNRS